MEAHAGDERRRPHAGEQPPEARQQRQVRRACMTLRRSLWRQRLRGRVGFKTLASLHTTLSRTMACLRCPHRWGTGHAAGSRTHSSHREAAAWRRHTPRPPGQSRPRATAAGSLRTTSQMLATPFGLQFMLSSRHTRHDCLARYTSLRSFSASTAQRRTGPLSRKASTFVRHLANRSTQPATDSARSTVEAHPVCAPLSCVTPALSVFGRRTCDK